MNDILELVLKVIFLDMDGVMNSMPFLLEHSAEYKKPDGTPYTRADSEMWVEMIDPKCVERLNHIVTETGAVVVISSSWRHAHTVEAMREFFDARGFVGKIIDETPTIAGPRGREIEAWLADKNVKAFVVLDDDSDMDGVRKWHIKTSILVGLQDEHVERTIQMLNGGSR
jgi:hypothetical protein